MIEIEYKNARIDKQGGMEAIVRTLVKKFGNADNIYMNRRTWHQPNAGRRADFYTSATGAQLVVTDTNLVGDHRGPRESHVAGRKRPMGILSRSFSRRFAVAGADVALI